MMDDLVGIVDEDRGNNVGVVLRVDDGPSEQALLVLICLE